MAKTIEIKVPDIGDFDKVPVIEVLVSAGDQVEKEQGLITLESDKATMEVPSTHAGKVVEVKVSEGDDVAQGAVIVVLEASDSDDAEGAPPSPRRGEGRDEVAPPPQPVQPSGRSSAREPVARNRTSSPPTSGGGSNTGAPSSEKQGESNAGAKPKKGAEETGRKADIECQVLVLGSGPGGYSAAFRAADLDQDTVLVERYPSLGGVCLNVGCIPSKALLHTAGVIDAADAMAAHGVSFGKPKIKLDKLREFKNEVVGKLTDGLKQMAGKREVKVVQGNGTFVSPHELEVEGSDGKKKLIRFEKAIIAAGSQSLKLPMFPWDDDRVMDSTRALALADIPKKLLVVGGGIIGLELATVYAALGSEVTVVELMDQIMPGADKDLIKPLAKRIETRYKGIHLKTKVTEAKAQKNGIKVEFEGESIPENKIYDRVLVSVGRSPNGGKIGADKAGVEVDDRGFIAVDRQMRTNVEHIFAIGDLVGQPMLAHKATHEAKVAAEVCAGMKSQFDARVIPSVAYTDPEVAWVGVSEREAKDKKLDVGIGKFPWAASGRALGMDRSEGLTKLIFDKESKRIIGAGIVGVHAGDLISELALAIEMGCEAADISLTIHPHPTLSESVGMAAEVFEGTLTDLYLPKRK